MAQKTDKKSKLQKNETVKITETAIPVKFLVKKPLISEKGQSLLTNNQYVFLVDVRANKNEIKEEIRHRYGVGIENINTVKNPGKITRFRNKISRKESIKKAIVTLKSGDKIDVA
jgi:large subunit ribosomal protein L23